MPRQKKPTYEYIPSRNEYRKRIKDADGKYVAIYAKTPDELTEKVNNAIREIQAATFRRENPTVNDYCEKWLQMQAAHVKITTLNDYRSIIKIYIQQTIGSMYMSEVTADDLKLHVLTNAASKSKSVYGKVNMLLKLIFTSAVKSYIIDESPADNLSAKGGKEPKEEDALSDEQVKILLDATRGLPPYPFIMLGLYAGLRREEALALQWDCVDLESNTPSIKIRRAWHTEHNRPVVIDELKTKAASRTIPIPSQLAQCLKDVKEKSTSNYVIANNTDGGPLSGTQWARLWNYVTVRSTKVRTYTRYLPNGEKIKRTVTPVLGEKAAHNSSVIYSIDFPVHPHQLRKTYITNLCEKNVDPKTVQYLAGHKNIRITMDIYAKVKYNKPEDIADKINQAFSGSI